MLTTTIVALSLLADPTAAAASARALPAVPAAPPRSLRVLIVTGDDVPAHRWRENVPDTRAILEAAPPGVKGPVCRVKVCEDAGILAAGALEEYDVVVLEYRNNPRRDPGERAREGLARFVRGGGGLLVVHFSLYAFSGWDEYRNLVGRVWIGRREGKKISGHGPRGPFEARVIDREHFVTRGMESFEIDDEVYAKLVGDAPIHVLVEADSEFSGKVEPILWTRRYGKGRVCVNTLGHDLSSRKNPAFRRLVRRGVLWAAGAGD